MVDRLPLDAIVFDAGGTLVRLDFEWIASMLATLGVAATADELRRGEVRGRRQYDLSAGHPHGLATGETHPPLGSAGDTTAYFRGTLEAVGVRHPVLEEAIALMFEKQRPPGYLWGRAVDGARETLDRLTARGARLACVSNSDGRAEQHLIECGVREGLEFVVDSQVVGVEKPNPAIFRIALDRLGVAPERALYVGDIRSVDERGSRAAGMRFVLIDPYGDYAGPETPAIATISQLPRYIDDTFDLMVAEDRVRG